MFCLPVHYTQTDRSTPRNDIYWFSGTGKYVYAYLLYISIKTLTNIKIFYILLLNAGVSQLVEYKLPKLGVASSTLVTRLLYMKRINIIILMLILILVSCTKHKNIAEVHDDINLRVAFMTRINFAYFIMEGVKIDRDRINSIKITDIADSNNSILSYVINKQYMYLYPDGSFKPDKLLTWVDFIMFTGKFYYRMKGNNDIAIELGEYNYLNKLISRLIGNSILSIEEAKNFKGNFPIPIGIVKDKVNKIRGIVR